MRRVIGMVVTILALTASYGFADMGGMMGEQKSEGKQQGMMDGGMMKQMMPMMQMCMPMMQQMMGQGMMMQDMMRLMMDMMKMQKKMMKGMGPAEKKEIMMDMDKMMGGMDKMMSLHMSMMMGMDNSQASLKCAEGWLKKAIDLHELHMKDPKTTTEASQMELMEQIKKAYGCIAGTGSEMSGPTSKELESKEPKKEEPSKTDLHKH